MNEITPNLAAALVAAQAEIQRVAFDAVNPFLHNKYASLGAIIEASRPILAKTGLAVVQFPESEGNQIRVRTRILHRSGEYTDSTIGIDVSEEKGKSRAQVAGSIITYLRRYSWASVLGMYADEDTDGNEQPKAATRTQRAPEPQTTSATDEPATRSHPAPETPEHRRQRWIAACLEAGGGDRQYAEQVFEATGVMEAMAHLDDFPIDKVPTSRTTADVILGQIRTLRAQQEAPKAKAPKPVDPVTDDDGIESPVPPQDDAIGITGYLKVCTKKPSRKDGKPYWSLLVTDTPDQQEGGTWISCWSQTDGPTAESLKGKRVVVRYTVKGEFKNLAERGIQAAE